VNDGNDTLIVNGQLRHVFGYLADSSFPRRRGRGEIAVGR
jgi:hypothetical protein